MKVILTEKPSVARDIARCLNINQRHDGYFSGNGYQITWAFGHLVELKEPDDYRPDWKRWNLAALPIIPEHFELKARGDEGAQKQLQTIKRLFIGADELICATDAGREGELIFRYILSFSQCQAKPIKRLWISSLTDEAIRQGFATLYDSSRFDGLYRAARCRSEADWLVGINATRLYTLKHGQSGQLWTIGRVQTPVLAMIVQKDQEIAQFVPQDFWELHVLYRNTDFIYTGGRFSDKTAAETLCAACTHQQFEITSVKGKRENLNPPLPYDLTELQKHMNQRYGFTAEYTLDLAQKLYERKHITYPRTDSRYLSADLQTTMKPLLNKLRQHFAQPLEALNLDSLNAYNRCFNDSKITDHHAIIPTQTLPAALTGDEGKLYTAVALRLIAAFYPPCIKRITTILGKVHGTEAEFKTTGTILESPGWQVLFKDNEQQDKSQKLLPAFVEGETGEQQPEVVSGKTTPPKPYHESSLLAMMEAAGKICTDEAAKEAMKAKGLGTPATRAAIIEVLIKRGYVERRKKTLLSTEAGRHLIALIQDELLKSPALTGEWEAKLKQIEQNGYDADQFINEIIAFTEHLKRYAEAPTYDPNRFGDCPLCHQPVIEGKQAYGCSAWKTGCSFILPKNYHGIHIDKDLASQLLQNQRSHKTYSLHLNDQTLRAQLTLGPQGKLGYLATPVAKHGASESSVGNCPLCNAAVIETAKAFGCSEWRDGCTFVIWKTIAHKKITLTIAKKLLKSGETDVLQGFKSTKGKEFAAKLTLIDGKVTLDFNHP